MNPGGRELIAADESTVVTETLLDTIVMEDGESDGSFSNSPWTRAIGVRFSARSMISSINLPPPKQALGDGGGNSPGILDANLNRWILW